MQTLEYCQMCTHPNTRPRITFNAEGICNGCVRTLEKKDTDWAAKEEEFKEVVAHALARRPDRQYDCIVPVSGGKDSTFQAWYALNTLKLHPLCVNIDPLLPTEVGRKNLRNLVERLGVDLLVFTPNQHVSARLARIMFERYGDPVVHITYLAFSHIARIAIEKRIPLILFGENGEKEYGGSTDKQYTELDNAGIHARIKSDKHDFLTPDQWTRFEIPEYQLRPYQEPSDEEMRAAGVERLFFSDYVPWTNNHHLYVSLNVVGGFQLRQERSVGSFTFGYSIDDDSYDLYIWMLWPKFGFCRSTKYTSKDIQEGKMTREKAIELVRKYDGEFPWHAVDRFCEWTGMKEEEFWNVVRRFIADRENLEREAKWSGRPMKIPAWEKIDPNTWRHAKTIHGEERILQIPMPRPR